MTDNTHYNQCYTIISAPSTTHTYNTVDLCIMVTHYNQCYTIISVPSTTHTYNTVDLCIMVTLPYSVTEVTLLYSNCQKGTLTSDCYRPPTIVL